VWAPTSDFDSTLPMAPYAKVFTGAMLWLTVVGEGLGEVLVGVGGEHVAEHVIRIGEVLHDIAGSGRDRSQAPGRGIEALDQRSDYDANAISTSLAIFSSGAT